MFRIVHIYPVHTEQTYIKSRNTAATVFLHCIPLCWWYVLSRTSISPTLEEFYCIVRLCFMKPMPMCQ